jgi:predicted alpha/beta hydrolase family esterase
MSQRAFIIHGYLGYPEEAWMPWLKRELEKRDFVVALPAMPHPDRPTIPEWVGFIADLVGEPDKETVIVAHSLGCQAVIRYLETLGEAGKSVGKTVLVAGRYPSGMPLADAVARVGPDSVLLPWLTVSVDPVMSGKAAGKTIVILSDNDPYIPFEEARASFESSLGATILVERGKGHFNEDDRVNELPSLLEAVLS